MTDVSGQHAINQASDASATSQHIYATLANVPSDISDKNFETLMFGLKAQAAQTRNDQLIQQVQIQIAAKQKERDSKRAHQVEMSGLQFQHMQGMTGLANQKFLGQQKMYYGDQSDIRNALNMSNYNRQKYQLGLGAQSVERALGFGAQSTQLQLGRGAQTTQLLLGKGEQGLRAYITQYMEDTKRKGLENMRERQLQEYQLGSQNLKLRGAVLSNLFGLKRNILQRDAADNLVRPYGGQQYYDNGRLITSSENLSTRRRNAALGNAGLTANTIVGYEAATSSDRSLEELAGAYADALATGTGGISNETRNLIKMSQGDYDEGSTALQAVINKAKKEGPPKEDAPLVFDELPTDTSGGYVEVESKELEGIPGDTTLKDDDGKTQKDAQYTNKVFQNILNKGNKHHQRVRLQEYITQIKTTWNNNFPLSSDYKPRFSQIINDSALDPIRKLYMKSWSVTQKQVNSVQKWQYNKYGHKTANITFRPKGYSVWSPGAPPAPPPELTDGDDV